MRTFLLFVAIILAATGFSQEVNISLEDRSKSLMHYSKWTLKEKSGFPDGNNVIQVEQSGINMAQLAYTARLNGQRHSITIRRIDETGKQLEKKELEGGDRAFGPIPSVSTAFGDKILLIYFKFEDKDTMRLYGSEVDRQSLTLANTMALFQYSQRNVSAFNMRKALDREIITRISNDGSRLLVMVPGMDGEYYTAILNQDLHLVRQNISTIQDKADLHISECYVDSAGNCMAAFSERPGLDGGNITQVARYILMQRASDNSDKLVKVESLGLQGDLHNLTF